MVKLIPKIEEKIEAVLKKLKLIPKESPIDFILRTKGRKHRYSTICKNKKGEKFIFYSRLHNSKTEKERMITEAKIAKFLMVNNVKFFPKYFGAEIKKNFEWILREYFNENTLENKKEIEKLARTLNKNEIFEICKVLLEMQKLKFPFLKPRELKKFFILPEEIEKRKILTSFETKKIKKIFKKNQKLIKNENKYFTHGDFQIGNLIFTKNRLKVIDLESSMLSNFAYDSCFFWVRLWKEEKIRKEFLKNFLLILPKEKEEKFKILFQIDALFLCFHSFCATPKEYSKNILIKRKKYFLNGIKKAILGFDSLLKL